MVSRYAVLLPVPGQAASVSSPRPSIRACGSPAHGLPTSFTAGIQLFPPVLKGPGSNNSSRQGDQP